MIEGKDERRLKNLLVEFREFIDEHPRIKFNWHHRLRCLDEEVENMLKEMGIELESED